MKEEQEEFKFKKKISTANLWYDLFDGGYIKPEKVLARKEDVIAVVRAIEVLKRFRYLGEKQGMIEYY